MGHEVGRNVVIEPGTIIGDGCRILDNTVVGSAEAMGTAIFTLWVLPFEVLSVLLLAALVGAIVLSRLRADLSGADVAGTTPPPDNSAARGDR